MPAGFLLIQNVHIYIHCILIAADHHSFKSDFASGAPCQRVRLVIIILGIMVKRKVKQKQGKKEAVIVGIVHNGIVQDQQEENENDPQAEKS